MAWKKPAEKFRDSSAPLLEQQINNIEEGLEESESGALIKAEGITGGKVAPSVFGRRLVWGSTGVLTAAKGVATYYPLKTGAELLEATALKIEYTTAPDIFRLKKADWEITGRTIKMLTTQSVLVNAKAPGSTFTAGLYQVEKSAGATGKNAVTFKTVTASSTVNPNVAPAAETLTETVSAEFAFPTDGFYSLGLATTVEALKAESQVLLNVSLFIIYT